MTQSKVKEAKFGVHSEVGQLRKVLVCAPGRAHQRLTPSNSDQLLFDDVLWVENAYPSGIFEVLQVLGKRESLARLADQARSAA